MKKLRVLVIEDSLKQIEAAQVQLADHEVTICSSFREAEMVLAGAKNGCWYKGDAEFPFDAILTDLFLPPSPVGTVSCVQHYEKEEDVIKRDLPETIARFGEEIPYGLVIVLASMRRNTPVSIVSDKSHHSHPINWALDLVASRERLLLGTSHFLAMEGCYLMTKNANGERVKDWRKALEILMKEA
jgi:CheY-like chemotaxis protein